MSNQMYELVFVCAGLAWAGLAGLVLVVLAGVRKLRAPKPPKFPRLQEWEDQLKRWQ